MKSTIGYAIVTKRGKIVKEVHYEGLAIYKNKKAAESYYSDADNYGEKIIKVKIEEL